MQGALVPTECLLLLLSFLTVFRGAAQRSLQSCWGTKCMRGNEAGSALGKARTLTPVLSLSGPHTFTF